MRAMRSTLLLLIAFSLPKFIIIKLFNKIMLNAFDLFGFSQFVLYRGRDEYTTKTGGLISILIFGILITIFTAMAIDTFNSTNIAVSIEETFDLDPSYYKISPKINNFRIAFGLQGGLDIKYDNLNFRMFNNTYKNRFDRKVNNIPLKPCNFSDWQGIDSRIDKSFHSFDLQNLLCPPSQFQFELQGKTYSQIFKFARISFRYCQQGQTCSVGKPAYPQNNSTIIKLKIFYINSIINPQNKNPISYQIADKIDFQIDFSHLITGKIQFIEYKIETDWSLMPWSSIKQQRGIRAKVSFFNPIFLTSANKYYASISLKKSGEGIVIKRSFQKITSAISFVGGLLNPILFLMLIMKFYNRFAFEMQIGFNFFKADPNSTYSPSNLNFWHFLKYATFKLLSAVRLRPSWKEVNDYDECRSETTKQLDIYLLYQKIERFEEVCSTLFKNHQQIGLHLLPKRTLKEAKKIRQRYKIQEFVEGKPEKLLSKSTKNKNIKSNLQQSPSIDPQQIYAGKPPQANEKDEAHRQFCESYKRLREESLKGCRLSGAIMARISTKAKSEDELISIHLTEDDRDNARASDHCLQTNTNLVRSSQQTL